jgi:hypothetical protein
MSKKGLTEAEWEGSADPARMLKCLRGKASDRKLRLFACACIRQHWPIIYKPNRRLIQWQEDHPETRCDPADWPSRQAAWKDSFAGDPAKLARQALIFHTHQPVYASLLRCVFGNPFRPASLPDLWRTPDAVALARSVYDARDFGPQRLGVLADALEDAGCTDEGILSHLRGPGPHVRGCWAVDLVLGKG